jgi:hypothetical protein
VATCLFACQDGLRRLDCSPVASCYITISLRQRRSNTRFGFRLAPKLVPSLNTNTAQSRTSSVPRHPALTPILNTQSDQPLTPSTSQLYLPNPSRNAVEAVERERENTAQRKLKLSKLVVRRIEGVILNQRSLLQIA